MQTKKRCEILFLEKNKSTLSQQRQQLFFPSTNLSKADNFDYGKVHKILKGSTLFCFSKSKQKICLQEGWVR